MKTNVARWCRAFLAGGCSLAFAAAAHAQTDNYPSRPVTIVMPASPGGSSDTIARTMAQKLSEIWGQPVIVDNKPGAAGVIGTEIVAKAKPDGYTLLAGFSEHAWMKYFGSKPTFDMNRDFIPIMLVGDVPNVVAINSTIKANTLNELIALLKANPGKFNFGGGVGTTLHLYGELFKKQAGVDIVNVPYKGGNEANLAMISGEIEMVFPTALSVQQHVVSGRARVLAVSADQRLPIFPDVPTVAEAGMPDLRISIWHCIFAPAGTPKEIVAKISAALIKAGNSPDVRAKLNAAGVKLIASTPEEFAAFYKAEQKRWSDVIQGANIKLQ